MTKSPFRRHLRGLVAGLCLLALGAPAFAQDDPLPSWNAGKTKQSILDFVAAATDQGKDTFVQPEDRIAVFDNDGTLWIEQPAYVQLVFALDRIKALASENPDWQTTEPFASILKGDIEKAFAGGDKAVVAIVEASHSGLTVEQFTKVVQDWLATARHPKFDKPYTALVFQPMLEVLAYLRANGFKTYIVSGGGIDFMRAFAEKVYGVPPEQVVGSNGKLKFDIVDGVPVLLKLPEVDFIDDGPGKPVGIQMNIGRKPVAAFGNSDGDLQMLQYTCMTDGPHLCLYVHHTDADREYAYDRDSHFGKLDKGLEAAGQFGWSVADMKTDWKTVFPASP